MTKKADKLAEKAAFSAKVTAVLAEAYAAADTASAAWAATAKRTPEGRILDLCGGAMLRLYKPSYRLREALKALGEVAHDTDGAWIVSHPHHRWTSIPEQSATLEEVGCRAAREVLERAFPGEGDFYAVPYID